LAQRFSVLIRGGKVIDGTGSAAAEADIAISGETIAAIEPRTGPDGTGLLSSATAELEIDAEGLTLCPGFIDIHTHADIALLARPEHLPKTMQGVTTEVFTNCGLGFAPVAGEALQIQKRYSAGLFGSDLGEQGETGRVDWAWSSVADFLSRYESAGAGTNIAYLIPHGSVRVSVLGMQERIATAAEVEQMRSMVQQGMEEGAFGMSTGIWYAPMRSADMRELSTLFRCAGFFATHQRDYGAALFPATDESIEIAKQADVPVQISHLQMNGAANRGRAGDLLAMLDRARASGVDVTCDTYPYTAGSTFVQSLLPSWAVEGDPELILKRLADSTDSARIVEHLDTLDVVWEQYCLVGSQSARTRVLEGLSFPTAAADLGIPVSEFICMVLREDELKACYVHHAAHEENVREILAWDGQMVGSDGLHLSGKMHPRLYGTFPRVLGKYVREESVISLEQAVYKMTAAPAQRLGLHRRGKLVPGYFADIAIINPDSVLDTGTYTNPVSYPDGVPHVLVNGIAVKLNGSPTRALPGRVLRKSAV
jgi:N-acyl-D-amino-acid deacylase